MSRNGRYWVIGLVFIGLALRLPGLFGNSLGADEALFGYWARLIGVWRDPLLLGEVVDKPPLLFYLQAGFYPLLGPVEFAARMPNIVASVLLIPLAGRLAWRVFGEEMVGVLTAAFVAFSPIAIQFSGTAFTDPLLVLWLTGACLAAVGGGRYRAGWAGVLLGLGLLTKHQALLFLPLVTGLLYLSGAGRREWGRFLAGFLAMALVLVGWEMVRNGGFTLWQAQLDAFGGLRIIHSWELWPRLGEWGEQWGYLIGSPILAFGILLALPLFLALLIHDQDRPTAFDQLFVLFVCGYFVLHWLLAIPVWERYILPLTPLAAIILSRFLSRLLAFLRKEIPSEYEGWMAPARMTVLLPAALLVFQGPAVWQARAGELPIGGRPSADDGVGEIAELLVDMPYGTVLYDHWYSQQWRYHLFDKGVHVSWFGSPAALAEELMVFGRDGNRHFLALPDSAVALPVERAVTAAGFGLALRGTAEQPGGSTAVRLFEIVAADE